MAHNQASTAVLPAAGHRRSLGTFLALTGMASYNPLPSQARESAASELREEQRQYELNDIGLAWRVHPERGAEEQASIRFSSQP